MRTVFIIAGVLVILFGLLLITSNSRVINSVFFIGGAGLFIAGIKAYRGEWPTFIGIIIIIFGAAGLNYYIGEYFVHSGEYLEFIFFCIFLILVGSLLLGSGHKLHKYSVEIEVLRSSREETYQDETQSTP